MTLTTVTRRKHALRRAQEAFEAAIREAIEVEESKTAVARAAGISRPTLYAILNR